MKLKEYIEENGTTMAHIARITGLSVNSVRSVIQGRDMEFSILLKIRDATKGEVTLDDMIPIKYLKYLTEKKSDKKENNKKYTK